MKNILNKEFSKPTFALVPMLAVMLMAMDMNVIITLLGVTVASVIGVYFNTETTKEGEVFRAPGLHKYDAVYIALAYVIIIVGYIAAPFFNLGS